MEGCKSVAAGVNVMDLRSGISMAVDAVIADLKSRSLMISTQEEITQVSFIVVVTFGVENHLTAHNWSRRRVILCTKNAGAYILLRPFSV